MTISDGTWHVDTLHSSLCLLRTLTFHNLSCQIHLILDQNDSNTMFWYKSWKPKWTKLKLGPVLVALVRFYLFSCFNWNCLNTYILKVSFFCFIYLFNSLSSSEELHLLLKLLKPCNRIWGAQKLKNFTFLFFLTSPFTNPKIWDTDAVLWFFFWGEFLYWCNPCLKLLTLFLRILFSE